MATRNRTVLFKKYRDALRDFKKPSSSSEASTSTSGYGGSGPVIQLSTAPFLQQQAHNYTALSTDDADTNRGDAVTIGLPPAWVDISEEIATNMQRARSKIAMLAKSYAKALMPTFGDTTEDQHAIEELTQEITRLLKRSEQMLQKLSGRGLSEDANVQKNVQRSLATDLQALSMEFRKQQNAYLQRLRQQKDGSDEVDMGMNLNDPKTRYEDDQSFDSAFSTQQLARMKKTEVLTAEREREILQIVESVNQLQQIMKDLSTLVIDQGTIVDRIDYNIQNVAASVDKGVKELEKVGTYVYNILLARSVGIICPHHSLVWQREPRSKEAWLCVLQHSYSCAFSCFSCLSSKKYSFDIRSRTSWFFTSYYRLVSTR